ncbi:hypothetical protein [Desulfitobacterium dehalogenans]|uniref:hypothetical protein n=1 Tax=Desulfitobacterium dehalogenans TaxID=36854 RepID=UPI0003785C1F|nr:hypothetical protein [Desulfitobacterium dehalogenans]
MAVMQLSRLYDPIDKAAKVNWANCRRRTGKRCGNEAELLLEEQKRYGLMDRMMSGNRGI